MKSNLLSFAKETLQGVFHAHNWGQEFSEDLINELIEEAKINLNRKARLCLHPSPANSLQVTYLAFSRPYTDRIHYHPHSPEVNIPILGQAKFLTLNDEGEVISSQILDGASPVAVSTPTGVWHSLNVLSPNFVTLEVKTGPFLKDSTVHL